jgi:hypothetical protein
MGILNEPGTRSGDGGKAMDETAPEVGGADLRDGAAELLAALAPRDALEAMLASQMAAAHAAAVRAFERAAECAEHPQIEALYMRQAARLMHLFVRQMEALDKRRAAAEARAEQKARAAYFLEKEQREEEERAFRLDGRPRPRRRRRAERTGGRGNGAAHTRNELADGLYSPDPMPG